MNGGNWMITQVLIDLLRSGFWTQSLEIISRTAQISSSEESTVSAAAPRPVSSRHIPELWPIIYPYSCWPAQNGPGGWPLLCFCFLNLKQEYLIDRVEITSWTLAAGSLINVGFSSLLSSSEGSWNRSYTNWWPTVVPQRFLNFKLCWQII